MAPVSRLLSRLKAIALWLFKSHRTMPKKVCFLLGSGVSIPAELPSISEITQEILSGECFAWEKNRPLRLKTDAEKLGPRVVGPPSYADSDNDRWNEHVRPILLLVSWLKVQAERRYAAWPGREVNYEDIAYLAGQLHDDLLDNYENPALIPFVNKALDELAGLLVGATHSTSSKRDPKEVLRELTGMAVDYVRYAVALLLGDTGVEHESGYLRLFVEAADDPSVTELNIFTLNHDTLVESSFTKNAQHLCLTDGFARAEQGFRRWDPSLFDSAGKVRLYKLHGAVDWRRVEPKHRNSANPRAEEFVGIQTGASSKYQAVGDPPLLLAGTFNKLFDYTHGIFLELQYRFHRELAESAHLIVCGYSFGDKGINQRIVERMTSVPPCKLLVIDPIPLQGLKLKARGAIDNNLGDWDTERRFVHWQYRLEDGQSVSWKRIRSDFLDWHPDAAHSGR